MAVDLHLHSTFSDGSDEPEDLVAAAHRVGLTAIALTDHDNLGGIERATAAADEAGISLIPGTELSVDWDSGAMHLLVYFLEPGPGPLQDELVSIQEGREERNREMIDQLNRVGIEITDADVIERSGEGVTGRPHFAAVLVAKGHAESISDAFDRYLARGRPGYVPRRRLTAHAAIELAKLSGCVTSVAHPHTLGVGADEYAAAFTSLAGMGLDGIEAHYAEYTPEVREHLASIARQLDLVATGGSDYHGSFKPGLSIGTGYGDLMVPDDAAEALHGRRDRLRS